MTPSGLVSIVTFLIIMPTALTVRLLTLLNLNAVVLHCPSVLLLYGNGALASLNNNSTPTFDSKDQTADYLPLWLSHILQNHNLSQSLPPWKGLHAPVAVSIRLTFDFLQPSVNRSFDHMLTINTTEPILRNEIPQPIVPSDAAAHHHNKTLYPSVSCDHENCELRTEKPFQLVVILYAVGLLLVCLAVWCQPPRMRPSYRSLLRMARKLKVAVLFRVRNEYARNWKDTRVPPYEDITHKESGTWVHLLTHESSIREWTPEDDYETDVTNIAEPDHTMLAPHDPVAGFDESRMLKIALDSSFSSEASFHPGSVPCGDSDWTFVDAGIPTCQHEYEGPLSYHPLVSDLFHLGSDRFPSGPHHSSLRAGDSELGTFGNADFYSVDDDHNTLLEVSQSGYFTNAEGLFVQKQTDLPRSTPQETSLIHLPRRLTSQEDPPIVACRELVLHSRYPRAWEVDDLVAAWRCFARSRGGKRWVAYGIIGITALLEAALTNFLAPGLRGHG